jgi:hypothetical protein
VKQWQEFEQEYAARSGVTVKWLHENGLNVYACECGEEGCEGYQMLSWAQAEREGDAGRADSGWPLRHRSRSGDG